MRNQSISGRALHRYAFSGDKRFIMEGKETPLQQHNQEEVSQSQ